MKFLNALVYSNRPGIRLLRHALFWITDLANHLIVVLGPQNEIPLSFYIFLYKLPLIGAAVYFILYYIMPLAGKPGSTPRIIGWCLAVLVFLSIGVRYYKYYVVAPLIDPEYTIISPVWHVPQIIAEIFSSMVLVCMAVTIKLLKTSSVLQGRNVKLQQEKKVAELSFLKAQMQPHFLFNTLNTLYAETMQQSAKAQQVVLHLSNMLRFMLEECSKPAIPLRSEIKVVRDFIALEQLRHGERLNVTINVGEDLPKSAMISPLIFLPFVENSFKHTLARMRGTINIAVSIGMKDERVFLQVENDFPHSAQKVNENTLGMGMQNARRQLDLLYQHNYSLSAGLANDKYSVLLTVPLTLHHG